MAKYQIRNGAKTVTTAGTRVALSSSDLWVTGLKLSAPAANSGVVYIGDVSVAASNGYVMSAGAQVDFKDLAGSSPAPSDVARFNLKNMYVDAATNGDKLTFCYFEEVL